MADDTRVQSLPIPGGRIEHLLLAGGPAGPPPVLGGGGGGGGMAGRGAGEEFLAQLADQLRPAGSGVAESPTPASNFLPRPSTPERFIGELRATLDPSSFVTDRLPEIAVPALVLAGGQDQVVPPEATRLVADRIPGARFIIDR